MDIQQIAKNGIMWTYIGSFFSKTSGILYLLLILSYLSVYEYGVVTLVLSVPALLAILSLPGLEQSIVADLAQKRKDARRKDSFHIYISFLSLKILLGLAGWLALFFGAEILSEYYHANIVNAIKIASFTFLLGPIRAGMLALFKVELDFKMVAIYRAAEEVGKLAVLAVCIFYWDAGIIAPIFAYIGADIIAIIVCMVFYIKHLKTSFVGCSKYIKLMSPHTILSGHRKWSIASSYVSTLGQNIRPWIIKLMLGTEVVGIYSLARGMYQQTSSMFSIAPIFAPIVPNYIKNEKQLKIAINTAVKYQILIMMFSGIVFATIFLFLIHTIIPKYISAFPLYLTLLLTMLPVAFTSIFEPVFHAIQKQKNLFSASVSKTVGIIIFLPICIYFAGITGIAIEFMLTRAIYSVGRYKMLQKYIKGYQFYWHSLFHVSKFDYMILQKIKFFKS